MVTLKDFLELDSSICGVELHIRENGSRLLEEHVFGVGGWPGNNRDYVSENTYREVHLAGSKEILIHIHPDPINFVQTNEPYRGLCRPWGILMKKFPKKLLKLEVKRISSFSAAFRGKKTNGSYYLIDLVADAGTAPADCLSVNVEELLGKEEQKEQDDKLDVYCDNMTIYEYLEQEENQDD